MKKLKVLVIVVFIVNIIGLNFAVAQTTGTAFLRPEFEYQQNTNKIIEGFQTAAIKAFGSGDVSCFERDADQTPNKPAPEIVRDMLTHIRTISGKSSITGTEAAELIKYHTTYKIVHADYWRTHESAYIDSKTGQIMWCNPLNSSLFKDRTSWVIADVDVDGVTVEFIANCGNLCRLKEGDSNPNDGLEQFPSRQPVTPAPSYNVTNVTQKAFFSASPSRIHLGDSTTLSWNTQGYEHVSISGIGTNLPPNGNWSLSPQHTTTYILTAYPGARTASVIVYVNEGFANRYSVIPVPIVETRGWFSKNAGWVVPVAVVGIVGGIYLATHHPAASTTDNSYNNGFQGGSGSSGASGGSGGQQTWAVLHGSFGLSVMHVSTASGHQRSVAGFHLAIHL